MMSPKKDTKATADKNTKAGKNAPGMAKRQDAKKTAAAKPKK